MCLDVPLCVLCLCVMMCWNILYIQIYPSVCPYVSVCLCENVRVFMCDKSNSNQHGKMNIFTCSHAIPRPYQLSNGIFVPINIENGHDRLCALFWGCTILLLIATLAFKLCLIEIVQVQKYTLNFLDVWKVNGDNITLMKHTEKYHWNMKRLDVELSWKG